MRLQLQLISKEIILPNSVIKNLTDKSSVALQLRNQAVNKTLAIWCKELWCALFGFSSSKMTFRNCKLMLMSCSGTCQNKEIIYLRCYNVKHRIRERERERCCGDTNTNDQSIKPSLDRAGPPAVPVPLMHHTLWIQFQPGEIFNLNARSLRRGGIA